MNREIKFRAWDLVNIVENVSISVGKYWYKENNGERITFYDFETYPIMQYTGLKDKNGKEIYEGDIVKFWDEDMTKVRLEKCYFSDGQFKVNGTGDKVHIRDVAVAGNVWENPELLEKQ
jgi:hypothetical protein